MAFRSLVLVSLLLAGCAAGPPVVPTPGQQDAMAAVNAALSKRMLVMVAGTPVLK